MKKLVFVLLLGLGLTAFAQQGTTKPTKAEMEKMTPEQQTQKQLAKLTKELKLDANQQKQVGPLLTERNAKMKDLKMQKEAIDAKGAQATPDEKKAIKEKMMAQKNDFETKMKGVLTPEQYQKWMTMREEGKEKMKEHHNEMKDAEKKNKM